MLTPNHLYSHLSQNVMSDVRLIIENHLLHDWAINIEYTYDAQFTSNSWNKWGVTFFKISNYSGVIDAIFSCHVNNPLSSIRLYAERFSPASSFYFCICSARYNR